MMARETVRDPRTGAIPQGTQLRYVDDNNEEQIAFMDSKLSKGADTSDLVVVSVVLGVVTLTPVLGVQHASVAGGPPYWVE